MRIRNRITALFERKTREVLSVFVTAGFPKLNDLLPLCEALQLSGVDMIEVGIPFSDPVADGPTIQHSSEVALRNGMSMAVLFEQLAGLRARVSIPVLLMGYLNPVIQYGEERFFRQCGACGIDGVILPDLPLSEYQERYRGMCENRHLSAVFLVTSETSKDRIREIDRCSQGFIYAVSAPSITGGNIAIDAGREAYFRRLAGLKLTNPILVGFGISDRQSFARACAHLNGAIVGSAFLRAVEKAASSAEAAAGFVSGLRGQA